MPKDRFNAEQIVMPLRQIEVSIAQDKSAPVTCWAPIGIETPRLLTNKETERGDPPHSITCHRNPNPLPEQGTGNVSLQKVRTSANYGPKSTTSGTTWSSRLSSKSLDYNTDFRLARPLHHRRNGKLSFYISHLDGILRLRLAPLNTRFNTASYTAAARFQCP